MYKFVHFRKMAEILFSWLKFNCLGKLINNESIRIFHLSNFAVTSGFTTHSIIYLLENNSYLSSNFKI